MEEKNNLKESGNSYSEELINSNLEEMEDNHSGEAKSNPIKIKKKSNRSCIPTWKEYVGAGMLKKIHNNSKGL